MKTSVHDPYTLLHLADSACPTGGFAFSQGLESMAKLGLIQSENDFREYLSSQLRLIAEFDLPFINSAYSLDYRSNPSGLVEMIEEWGALNTVESIRKGSAILGENWFDLIRSAYNPDGADELEGQFRAHALPMYFQIVLPLSLRLIGFERDSIQQLVFHMTLRDQISAAIRLGLLGPLKAQALFPRFSAECETLRERHAEDTYHIASRSQPMIEMAQTNHRYLYSKLFQN